MVSIFVLQSGSQGISSHSYLRLLNVPMLVAVEVCDGRAHLVRGSGEAHRHQDADARESVNARGKRIEVLSNYELGGRERSGTN